MPCTVRLASGERGPGGLAWEHTCGAPAFSATRSCPLGVRRGCRQVSPVDREGSVPDRAPGREDEGTLQSTPGPLALGTGGEVRSSGLP